MWQSYIIFLSRLICVYLQGKKILDLLDATDGGCGPRATPSRYHNRSTISLKHPASSCVSLVCKCVVLNSTRFAQIHTYIYISHLEFIDGIDGDGYDWCHIDLIITLAAQRSLGRDHFIEVVRAFRKRHARSSWYYSHWRHHGDSVLHFASEMSVGGFPCTGSVFVILFIIYPRDLSS